MGPVAGIDVGETNFCLNCVVKDGVLNHFEKRSSASILKEGAVEILCKKIRGYMKRYPLAGRIGAIPVGMPSVVGEDKSFVYSTSNLKELEDIDLDRLLEGGLGIWVFVNRDVNYLLCHDIRKYNSDPGGDKTIPDIYLGAGFDNTIYVNGRFHADKNRIPGELDHIPFFHLKEICPCGNEGCVGLRCSGAYLQRIHDWYYPETEIGGIFTKYGNGPAICEYVEYLVYPISTEVAILDPDYVVMGRGVMIMKDFPMENSIRWVKERARYPYPSENLESIFPGHAQTGDATGDGLAAFDAIRRQ